VLAEQSASVKQDCPNKGQFDPGGGAKNTSYNHKYPIDNQYYEENIQQRQFVEEQRE